MMGCFIGKIVTQDTVLSDIKALIPDATMRRRMSRILKMSVPAAVECVGGIEEAGRLDAVITATSLGCLADSEVFLRNMISGGEQMLNPTPFIQSTFNTAGGQIACLGHNHCYNMTYVNREHSFEDALLDAFMRLEDGESSNVLVGAFDERTDSQYDIMRRMGVFRRYSYEEGCVFVHLASQRGEDSVARIRSIAFPGYAVSDEECLRDYSESADTVVLRVDPAVYGLCPTASSRLFSDAVALIRKGECSEVIVVNDIDPESPAVVVCAGL